MTRQTYKDCSRFDFGMAVVDRVSQKLGQKRIHRHKFYSYVGQIFHLRRDEAKNVLRELIDRGLVENSKRGIIFTGIKDRTSEET